MLARFGSALTYCEQSFFPAVGDAVELTCHGPSTRSGSQTKKEAGEPAPSWRSSLAG